MKLVICEKPSVAKGIAPFFGAARSATGYIEAGEYAVSWCFGHLLELADPDHYLPPGEIGKNGKRRWQRTDLPILPKNWTMRPTADADKQIAVIKDLLVKCDSMVNAGDPDREGQAIVDGLLEFLGNRKPVHRLWLAALDDESVKKAIAKIEPNTKFRGLYDAAIGRSRADWLIGMNLTRALTLASGSLITVGRVQTPTLAMVVRRDAAIRDFVVVNHYTPTATMPDGTVLEWQAGQRETDPEGRILARSLADQIAAETQPANWEVTKAEKKETTSAPPLPHSLDSLQVHLSKSHKMSAQQTLDACQALYEKHKLTTYPRTDCRYLPESMLEDRTRILAGIRPAFEAAVDGADPALKSGAWNDKKITAHHAIVPTGLPSGTALSADEQAAYDAICTAYIAQFYPSARYATGELEIQFSTADQYRATFKTLLSSGWLVLEPQAQDKAPRQMGAWSQGQTGTGAETAVLAKKTTPPKPYTEGTLLADMKAAAKFISDDALREALKEADGIGTPATRAAILEGLKKRGYLESKGDQLRSTPAGAAIVAGVPATLTDPGTTAVWENQLAEIAAGGGQLGDFVNGIEKMVVDLVAASDKTAIKTGQQSAASASDAKPLNAPCPKCGAPVSAGDKSVRCTKACGFQLWREVAHKKLTVAQLEKLLKAGTADKIDGFKSKAGKSFAAGLKLDSATGKIELVF